MKRHEALEQKLLSQLELEELLISSGIEARLPIIEDQADVNGRTIFSGPGYRPIGGPLGFAESRSFKRLISSREFRSRVRRKGTKSRKFVSTFPANEKLATLAEVVMAARDGRLDRGQEGYHAFPSRRTAIEPFHIGFSGAVTYIPCLLATAKGWKLEWVHGNLAFLFPTVVVEG